MGSNAIANILGLRVQTNPQQNLYPLSSAGIYQFGAFELDRKERRLLRNGVQVPLRPKVFETLRVLVESAGRLVTKEELLKEVWPDAIVEENNLNVSVSVLRKALGVGPHGKSYIETVPRIGYRFRAQVAQPALQPSSAPCGCPAVEQERSLVVLYFDNLSREPEDEYFRDGIIEDVITELTRIKDLRIFPRSAALAFREQTLSATQVGQQLGAAFVLEGSIRRVASRLRITARLAETTSGHAVWAERYDRELEDNFAVQDQIAQSIAHALRTLLSDDQKN
jgi:adenylate cyclase